MTPFHTEFGLWGCYFCEADVLNHLEIIFDDSRIGEENQRIKIIIALDKLVNDFKPIR